MGTKQRNQLQHLIGFRFTRHPSINLPEPHSEAIEKQIDLRVRKLLRCQEPKLHAETISNTDSDSPKDKAFGELFISFYCGEKCGKFFLEHLDTVSEFAYNEYADTMSEKLDAVRIEK